MTDHIRNKINLKKIVDAPDPTANSLGTPDPRYQVKGETAIVYMSPDGASVDTIKGDDSGQTTGGGTSNPAPTGAIKSNADLTGAPPNWIAGITIAGTTLQGGGGGGGGSGGNKEDANNKLDPTNPTGGGSGGVKKDAGTLPLPTPDSTAEEKSKKLSQIQDDLTKTWLSDLASGAIGLGGLQAPQNGGNLLRVLGDAIDCTGSDLKLDLRLDGNTVPPDGWIDENTPPDTSAGATQKKVIGIRWQVDGTPSGTIFAQSEADSVSATFGAFGYTESEFALDSREVVDDGFSDYHVIYLFTRLSPPAVLGFATFKHSCSPGIDTMCPISFPPTIWPPDGKMQVRRINGQYVINPNEPDADKFSLLATSINGYMDFCFIGPCPGDNCRSATIMPTWDGGFMIAETQYPGGPLKNYIETVNDPANPGSTIQKFTPGKVNVYDSIGNKVGYADTSTYTENLPGNPSPTLSVPPSET